MSCVSGPSYCMSNFTYQVVMFPLIKCLGNAWIMLRCKVVVGGNRQEILDLDFVLFGTHQQGVCIILKKMMLLDGFDPKSKCNTDRILKGIWKLWIPLIQSIGIYGNNRKHRYQTLLNTDLLKYRINVYTTDKWSIRSYLRNCYLYCKFMIRIL